MCRGACGTKLYEAHEWLGVDVIFGCPDMTLEQIRSHSEKMIADIRSSDDGSGQRMEQLHARERQAHAPRTSNPADVIRRWFDKKIGAMPKRTALIRATRGCDGCSVCKPNEAEPKP